MDEINYILNDQSNNDKQLIKELSIYIRNHKNNHLTINKKFVKDIIDILLKNSEVNYNSIIFVNDNDIIAGWNMDILQLIFNTTRIINIAKNLKKDFESNIGDNNILKYCYTLVTIIHEFTHIRQDYLAKKDKNEIYISCNNLIDENYDIYDEYHDEVLTERYANLRGWTLAYEVLSYVYPTEQIKEIRKYIYTYLIWGYQIVNGEDIVDAGLEQQLFKDFEIISALDNYNRIMELYSLTKINIDIDEEMSLYDRFYLGLPISTTEYQKLQSLYSDMFDDKIKVESVKKLIKKL